VFTGTTIQGPGADLLTIDGGQATNVFNVTSLATAAISGLTIVHGSTEYADGGGIFVSPEATLAVDGVYFLDNRAHSGGAMWIYGGAHVTVSDSAFVGNSGEYGGAIGVNSFEGMPAVVSIVNSTFTDNSAAYGGAIWDNALSEITLINCTVAGNSATTAGGGLATESGLAALHNTIVAGNATADGLSPDIAGTVAAQHALIESLAGVTLTPESADNIFSLPAELGALGYYGGPTPTRPLLAGSPAIDAGDNLLAVDAAGQPLPFDQRGELFARIANGTVDLGAFEFISLNDGPMLSDVPSEVTIPELTAYGFTAVATDEDLPPQSLVFSLIDEPDGATIDPTSGVFTWTPSEAQGPGDYAFTVRVSDGEAYDEAAIAIHVAEANAPPVAQNFAVTLTGGSMTIPVLQQAADPDGDVLALISVTQGANGSIVVNSDGTVSYALTQFVSTTDQFAYTVSDSKGGTATGVVTVRCEVPPVVVIDLIERQVQNLDLNRSQERLLVAELRVAESLIDRGFTGLAEVPLRLFTLHLRLLEAVHWLSDADADLLVDEVEALIDLLD
jgi:hypothetical protein